MIQTSNRFGRRRGGLTLVEVVAALTLLAALIAGILLAYGTHQRQLRAAEDRFEAIAVADRLLSGWYGSDRSIPKNRTGQVAGSKFAWQWKTTTVARQSLAGARFQIVRLELFRLTRSGRFGPAMSTVELVVNPPDAISDSPR